MQYGNHIFIYCLFSKWWNQKNEIRKKVFTLHRHIIIICITIYLLREDLLHLFTSLHNTSHYQTLKHDVLVKTREEMWRVRETLHANNLQIISKIKYSCEEWRLFLRACAERKTRVNTPTLHIFIISNTKAICYIHEEVPQHFMTLHKDFIRIMT